MDRAAIRSEVRRFLDDTVAPYEIADDALNERIDEAIREACVRADLIVDSSTAATCNLSVVAGEPEYSLSQLVLDVTRVKLPSVPAPISKRGYKFMDDRYNDWESTTGTPKHYLINMDARTLRIYPIPETDETATLTVSRLPLAGLADDAAEPEIAPAYHYDLCYWVLHLTYLTRDSQIFDPVAADRYEALFERRFGPRKTAQDLERNLRSYRRRGKASWF